MNHKSLWLGMIGGLLAVVILLPALGIAAGGPGSRIYLKGDDVLNESALKHPGDVKMRAFSAMATSTVLTSYAPPPGYLAATSSGTAEILLKNSTGQKFCLQIEDPGSTCSVSVSGGACVGDHYGLLPDETLSIRLPKHHDGATDKNNNDEAYGTVCGMFVAAPASENLYVVETRGIYCPSC